MASAGGETRADGRRVAPYGSWASPLTAEVLTAQALQFVSLRAAADALYWVECRPHESGRFVLVRRAADGTVTDVTAAPYSARSRVHEYGGQAFDVSDDDSVVFVNFADQRLYRVDPGEAPRPLTPDVALRFLQPTLDRARARVLAVCEDHRGAGEPINSVVAVPLDGGEPQTMVSGSDFYDTPALSPDGLRVAYMTWNHPNMPWDTTQVRVARLDDAGAVIADERVAGGDDESVGAPAWAPDGRLYYVSDRTGWWQLYREGDDEPLSPTGTEMPPMTGRYLFRSEREALCVLTGAGMSRLARIDLATRAVTDVATRFTELSSPTLLGDRLAVLGGSPAEPVSVVALDTDSGAAEVLRAGTDVELDRACLPHPEAFSFPTRDGDTAHAFFYPPTNPAFSPPAGERPPLLVMAHGGPVGATNTALTLGMYAIYSPAFWASRGYAIVDVNYRGSTGYGRRYRQALYGQWGVRDIDDCIDAARYLVARGDADPERIAIRGASAGGYTTLAALAYRDEFDAGVNYFGVSELELLAQETHKFEQHFLDHLVGPYPAARQVYRQRSPLHAVEQIDKPLLVLQGLDDRVVPANQSELIVEALAQRGVPVGYLAFEGEGHGFVRSETLAASLLAEHAFYGRVFGFSPADDVPALDLRNAGQGIGRSPLV
jgi:dipeptidyl aminopeptidase/acylaminoacyl peptidase